MKKRIIRSFGRVTAVGLCLVMLSIFVQRQAFAQDVEEYTRLATFLSLAAAGFAQVVGIPPGIKVAVGTTLAGAESDLNNAQTSLNSEDTPGEISSASSAIGKIRGSLGVIGERHAATSEELTRIVADAEILRALALERLLQGRCGNGILDPGEECDPAASPDGCPVEGFARCNPEDCTCTFIAPE